MNYSIEQNARQLPDSNQGSSCTSPIERTIPILVPSYLNREATKDTASSFDALKSRTGTGKRTRDSFNMPQARYLLSEEFLNKKVCVSEFFHLLNSKRGRPRKDMLNIPDFQLLKWLQIKSDQLHARYAVTSASRTQSNSSANSAPITIMNPIRLPTGAGSLTEIRLSSGWAHQEVALMKLSELKESGIIRVGESQRRQSEKRRLLARFIHYVKVRQIIARDEDELGHLIGQVEKLTAVSKQFIAECDFQKQQTSPTGQSGS